MSDDTTPGADNEKSFAELFAEYESGMRDDVTVGDKIRGKVIDVGETSIFLDTGTKVDGVADKSEFLDDDGNLTVAPGDDLDLYVVQVDGSEIKLSKALSGEGGLEMLREAFESDLPVEGKVEETVKGGFRVKLAGRRAFCPISQIDDVYVENPEDYLGQSFTFRIIKFAEGGRNIVLSRRDLLERVKREAADKLLKELDQGDVVTGKVSRLAPFGAFVTIGGGLDGLVHVSEMSWSRVDDPAEMLSPGEDVTVKILSMTDPETGAPKVSLSMKQATGDPFETLPERIKPGDKLTGTVTRLAPFGAFVEIEPGVEGLVHISEMSYAKRVHKPEEIVAPGETVSVQVKDIDTERRRLSLSIKEAEGDPWLDAPKQFPAGTAVRGTMEKREPFGMFVSLAPGVTGLIPKSRLERSQNAKQLDKLNPGDPVDVKVEEIRPQERRISLAPAGDDETVDWKQHARPAAPTPSGGMNTLGDKLQQALKDKE